MKYLVFVFCILFASVSAQTTLSGDASAVADQQLLKSICERLFSAKSDEDKKKYNQELLTAFESILSNPKSFEQSFDSLKNKMGILVSPDNKFRIINWNIEKSDKTHEYFGFIQSKYTEAGKGGRLNKKNETIQLYPLIDKSAEIRNPEHAITDNKKWFGMLYYKIVIKKTKAKTYYTLLGYDLNDQYSKKKIIDVLTFDNNGTPRFGADIFVMEKKFPKRVIFEYSATCNMSLRYNSQKDSLVFDHLAPTQPQLEGQFQYYCTDFSYDGFGFKRGKWNYGTDLNATNEKDEKDKFYHDPHSRSANKPSDKMIDKNRKIEKEKK